MLNMIKWANSEIEKPGQVPVRHILHVELRTSDFERVRRELTAALGMIGDTFVPQLRWYTCPVPDQEEKEQPPEQEAEAVGERLKDGEQVREQVKEREGEPKEKEADEGEEGEEGDEGEDDSAQHMTFLLRYPDPNPVIAAVMKRFFADFNAKLMEHSLGSVAFIMSQPLDK
jgi:hypothetical protein